MSWAQSQREGRKGLPSSWGLQKRSLLACREVLLTERGGTPAPIPPSHTHNPCPLGSALQQPLVFPRNDNSSHPTHSWGCGSRQLTYALQSHGNQPNNSITGLCALVCPHCTLHTREHTRTHEHTPFSYLEGLPSVF